MVSGRSSSGSSGSSSSCSFGGGPPVNNGGELLGGLGSSSMATGGGIGVGGQKQQQQSQVDMNMSQVVMMPQAGAVAVPVPVPATNGQTENNNHNSNNVLVTLQEKRIIAEFCHLLEKSKQLFNQLRELPPHGSSLSAPGSVQVQTIGSNNGATATPTTPASITASFFTCQQAYFSRAFDIYTRLWKYQQTHRNVLDKKYGLKRWQIGDIASKIGQLYYHYYLRTSEIAYLVEAANFYGAIRGRGYYARTPNSRRDSGTGTSGRSCRSNNTENGGGSGADSVLIVKKLRYYARFIIVSLLLRRNNVKELLRELSGHVENYVATVDEEPEEQLEWNLVLSEIRSFIDADSPVDVYEGIGNGEKTLMEQLELGVVGQAIVISHRLPREIIKYSTEDKADVTSGKSPYTLQEVLIIGNKQDQLKFSELTVDMFRMMQTFERSLPTDERSSSANPDGLSGTLGDPSMGDPEKDRISQGMKNPHKYLLYRASIEQILANLNSAWSELTWNGVLLVYISSDPSTNNGIATVNNSSKSGHHRTKILQEEGKEIHCLYPCDLLPLTRKPLVAIIDSENSHVFLQLGQQKENFGQPLVLLVSPESTSSPTYLLGKDHHHQHNHHPHNEGSLFCPPQQMSSGNRGSIFTLFLHNPLAGLCLLCGVKVVSAQTWAQMDSLLTTFYNEAMDHIREEAPQHNSDWDVYLKLFGDDFLRMVFLRYLFCHTVYAMHKESQVTATRPRSFPEVSLLNQDKIETSRFEELIFEMTDSIQSKNMFKRV